MSPQNPKAPTFQPGSAVEFVPDGEGFRGSWYSGTIIRRLSSRKNRNKFLVAYDTLKADNSGAKPLREIFDLEKLRPVPPRETGRNFKSGEEVDAYCNDGWWEGVITEELRGRKFLVLFRDSNEELQFEKSDLRLHRQWVNGNWVPPLAEENVLAMLEMNPGGITTWWKFSKGELVEVRTDEEGLEGAWFGATIVEAKGTDKFLVEYQTLRTDDDLEFLREEVDAVHIRPYPPEIVVVERFSPLEEVDALYNDGWWVGIVTKVLMNSRYTVYFRYTDEQMVFEHSQLRLHQEWIGGKWVIAS